ncbi:MAG: hypothetical protein IT435_17030 [Phycisphaerales bacterium]|nr:hypothetical protein [Phycisphaerales bacterium]
MSDQTASIPDHTRSAECPRCGYDLRGVIAAWKDSCPLNGTCSECGLAFGWRDLLNPRHITARRSFEHAEVRLVRSWLFTFLMSLLPGRFWRAMRMEAPIVRRRLIIFILVLIPICWISLGLFVALSVIHTHWAGAIIRGQFPAVQFNLPEPDPVKDAVLAFLYPFRDFPGVMYASYSPLLRMGWLYTTGAVLGWVVLMPLTFLALPETLRTAGVRPAHLRRATAYLLAIALFMSIARGIQTLLAGADLRESPNWLIALVAGPLTGSCGFPSCCSYPSRSSGGGVSASAISACRTRSALHLPSGSSRCWRS